MISSLSGHTFAQFDASQFRDTLSHFCSGVTIITGRNGTQLFGLTCQSFFSLSLAPPLIAFSPSKVSISYPALRQTGSFCVNVLSDTQESLGREFGRSGDDKWRNVSWRPGATGSPILEGVQAWIDCVFEAEHEGGDHFLAVGRVVALQSYDVKPLLYYRKEFVSLQE